MVKFYLVRHCEAMGNFKKSFQGRTDSDISEDGSRQLEYLKTRFRDIKIDKVFSSPLIRAYKTAVAATTDKNLTIIKDERFAEIDVGIIEGMPIDDIIEKHPWFMDAWDNNPETLDLPEGETMQNLYNRVWSGICDIAADPENEGKTVLVASHGCAIRNIICRILFNDITKLAYTPWSVNTAVSLIVFEDGKARLEFANDASHLPKELIRIGRLLTQKQGEIK